VREFGVNCLKKIIMKNEEKKKKDMIKAKPSMSVKNIMFNDITETVFDWDGLLYRLMGDEDLAKEIVDDFLKDIPVKLSALKEALNKKDALLVKSKAHIIKGASGNVGAVALQEIAERIEFAGEEDDLVKAELYAAKLDTLLEVFKKNVKQIG